MSPSDFFRTRDLEALAFFQRLDELAGLDQAVVGARVEPCIAAAEHLHVQLVVVEVDPIEVGDLELAAGARLKRASALNHLLVVKVESSHRITTFRRLGLLLQTHRPPAGIELDDTVTLGVGHRVGEHGSAGGALVSGP